MTAGTNGYQVDGEDGAYVISERGSGRTVGAYYRLGAEPGWRRGVVRGHVRRVFVPCAGPLAVAQRLLR